MGAQQPAGAGAAPVLVDYLFADARGSGFRIIPRWTYLRARYLKQSEWQDIMTVAPS